MEQNMALGPRPQGWDVFSISWLNLIIIPDNMRYLQENQG